MRRSWRTSLSWITPPTIGCSPRTSAWRGIGVHELVFGVPYYRMVNAAFTHPHPFGSRFNGPERGAWYAAFELRTAQAEVAFHKSVQLAEIGCLEEEVTYDDYQADVSAQLHDLREAPAFSACLAPESYVASQLLAERLLASGSLGVIYPSVRRAGGTCLSAVPAGPGDAAAQGQNLALPLEGEAGAGDRSRPDATYA